ncbi:thiopeptide-type bacteriocin biosynthesis protein [Streptomyces shenzhenensis]|uniref:thiopeptide-type bacteriocin biosynthesis protein n=1 Tax=Streptomyces shenzhenensis TaxID=943815 RepID=UPI0015F0FC4F|nr:thiopeptide-type bacteriocin biosynthesis protein [Streptomyces shenzhenensis]
MNSLTWCQVNIAFPDWEQAEAVALAQLAPLLRTVEDEGAVTSWFLIRKRPCWRVRYQPASDGPDRIGRGLDALIAGGYITGWTEIVYEPEVHAFGGVKAMECAHSLFHRDSRNLIDHLQGDVGRHRREISLMLCSLLMRSAGLDWYEQGDVWARVGEHRSHPADPDPSSRDRLHSRVRRLISVNGEELMRTGGSLAHAAGWARAYTDAGWDLAHLMDSGQLHRGLRDVVAHHVLFAWNRLGLPYATQAALASAAKAVVFGLDPTAERSTADRVESP